MRWIGTLIQFNQSINQSISRSINSKQLTIKPYRAVKYKFRHKSIEIEKLYFMITVVNMLILCIFNGVCVQGYGLKLTVTSKSLYILGECLQSSIIHFTCNKTAALVDQKPFCIYLCDYAHLALGLWCYNVHSEFCTLATSWPKLWTLAGIHPQKQHGSIFWKGLNPMSSIPLLVLLPTPVT